MDIPDFAEFSIEGDMKILKFNGIFYKGQAGWWEECDNVDIKNKKFKISYQRDFFDDWGVKYSKEYECYAFYLNGNLIWYDPFDNSFSVEEIDHPDYIDALTLIKYNNCTEENIPNEIKKYIEEHDMPPK